MKNSPLPHVLIQRCLTQLFLGSDVGDLLFLRFEHANILRNVEVISLEELVQHDEERISEALYRGVQVSIELFELNGRVEIPVV